MSLLRIATAFAEDLRQAGQRLFRSVGFATLAIGTLTIGIGITAAMFAVMDALLFRPPFHVAEPTEVMQVQFRIEGEPVLLERTGYPHFVDLRASGAFAVIAAYTPASVSIGSGRDASLVDAMLVSREFFDVLRPKPHLGSFALGDGSDSDGGDRAIISYGFWQRRFAGEPRAIGANVTIDGTVYSVVGVAPSGFQSLSARPVDVWLPLNHASAAGVGPRDWRNNRRRIWLSVVGRVARGASRGVAEERATLILESRRVALGDTRPAVDVVTTSIVPGRDANRSLESRVSLWLAGVSAFVLLIACANVSNLVVARAFAQRREYFIRLTLGASRWHLVRQSLADMCMIVIPGAAGALAVSFLLRNSVAALLAWDIPLSRHFWDARTAGIMIGSASVAFVLVCAVSLSQLRSATIGTERLARATNIKNVGRGPRRTLLAVQAGLCFVLLFVAGLFATSLRRVESLDLGVDLNRTIQVTMKLAGGPQSAGEVRAIYERARDVLATYPEVERATLAEGSPFMSGAGAGPWTAERSFAELWAERDEVAYRSTVGVGFFSTVGSLSLRGRDFNESDRVGAEPVAIVNAPLAKYLWPTTDAIGECMWLDDAAVCIRVVGVLGGVWKFSALKRDRMAVYLPLAQVPDAVPGALFLQFRGDAQALVAQVRSIVQSMRPDLPAARVVLLRDIVDPEFRPWRLGANVFSAFAVVALLIALIGLYGVVDVSTALRLKEIGIRRALGARWPHVIRVVVGEGLTSVGSGLVAGALLVGVVGRWLSDVLFETSPTDVGVVVRTAFILLVASAVAVIVPTVRALRTNPARVLRSE